VLTAAAGGLYGEGTAGRNTFRGKLVMPKVSPSTLTTAVGSGPALYPTTWIRFVDGLTATEYAVIVGVGTVWIGSNAAAGSADRTNAAPRSNRSSKGRIEPPVDQAGVRAPARL
jgi:hypothetical protein